MDNTPQGSILWIQKPSSFGETNCSIKIYEIPTELLSYIFEKMMYFDFVNFTSYDSFTSEIGQFVTFKTKLPLNAYEIDFSNRRPMVQNSNTKIKFCLPKNIHYIVKLLKIEPQQWSELMDYKVTAEIVNLGPTEISETVLQSIIKNTQASSLNCSILSRAALELPEVRLLKSVYLDTLDFRAVDFLTLPCPEISMLNFEPSVNLMKEFLSQWLREKRQIEDVRVLMYELEWWHFSIEMKRDFAPHISHYVSKHEPFWLCRDEEHKDCLQIYLDYETLCIIGGEGCYDD